MKPLNIVYMHSHDAGRYVQPYGYAIETPNIQRLAEQGVLFRQAFTVNPTCSPSRAALMTGQWAHCNGMTGLAHRGHTLNDYSQTLVWALRNAGYTTALSGVQHIARPPFAEIEQIGYQHQLTVKSDAAEASGEAVNFLENAPDQPFFLDVGFQQPHRHGYGFKADFDPPDDRYLRPPATLPDNPTTRKDMALYHASVRTADAGFGRVLEALDRNNLAHNTLVINTTDHGIPFPRNKCNLTDHGTGVMLIMRGPGGFADGKVVDAMVTHMDLYPTICELVGIDAPDFLQGKSLMPLISGKTDQLHDEIFAEVNYHAAYEPKRAVRTDRFKYIRTYGGRDRIVYANIDYSTSKDYWDDHGWSDIPIEHERLYDLVFDPGEANNLVSDPRHAKTLEDMRSRLDRWMRDTDDPILKGPIPLPEGAKVTDVDAYSPAGESREETSP